MSTRRTVAASVSAALGEAGVTRVAASEATGISPSKLRRRLAGETSFNLDELAAIASLLGIAPGDFIVAAFVGPPVELVAP